MDRKQMMDKLLENVPEDERKEVVKELVAAETMEERMEIAKRHAGKGAEGGDLWLADTLELSDEDLERIAGGEEMSWYDYGGCSCY